MLQHRHAIEGMQREMAWLAHLGLEIPKRVRRALMREDQPHNVDKSAAGKAEYDWIGHDRSPLARITAARTASRPRRAPLLASDADVPEHPLVLLDQFAQGLCVAGYARSRGAQR